jgi:CheY-like chemotaxis protein
MLMPPEHTARGHVLAVDDCATTRELVRASLELYGYSVQAVDSGWAALAAVEQDTFDAVVLDVEMPGMDGMAVGRALRGDPRFSAALIAMHSSLAEADVRTGFAQYDVFLSKSASPLTVGQRLDGLLKSRRS